MPGGVIPPDGRPARAPMEGKNARRHDLEKPKGPPPMHGSDLQMGDRQMLEQGMRTVQGPAKAQPRAGGQPPVRPGAPGQAPMAVPDPLQFLGKRMAGTLGQSDLSQRKDQGVDLRKWLPVLGKLAAGPGASGVLAQAFVSQMRNASKLSRNLDVRILDMNQFESDLEAELNRAPKRRR